MVGYDWDDKKNKENFKKHKVTFEEAITIFEDPLVAIDKDRSENYDEERFQALGRNQARKHLFVVFCEREDDLIWIISARKQMPREKRRLEKL